MFSSFKNVISNFYIKSTLQQLSLGNAGRTVISSVNCHISDIARYVVVQQIPFYIQDTSDIFIKN